MIERHTPVLHQFVMQLYGAVDEDVTTVDAARSHLFFHKGRDFDHMPPSSDALHQHIRRATYQSGQVWGNSLQKDPQPVSPTEWGWEQETLDTVPVPVYITIPTISRKIPELSICCCSSECKPPCTCCMNEQPCTTLCGCHYSLARDIPPMSVDQYGFENCCDPSETSWHTITHGRGFTESVLKKWIFGLPVAHHVCENVEELCGIQTSSSFQHIELRGSRITKDEEDLQKFVARLQQQSPFITTEDLVSLSSGLVATENINCYKALDVGK
ncbi:hypothetical protein Hamer_G025792 [Homarus americanus]|uniref:Uncharacterized protein n=1 Tax=Homarus americanus TaxID=6706 RepID=A0A8J5JTP7_HOMAM|nr:hypothetical protein Hamer_G025792 [Homarus americanus]